MHLTKPQIFAASAMVLAASLTGCSEPAPAGDSTKSSANGGLTQIAVSTSPSAGNTSLYLPINDGSYAAAGIEVTPQVLQSGAQAVPLLLNGQLQFAASDPVSAIVAISQGTPLTIVANGSVVPHDAAADPNSAIVAKDSAITSPVDLNGKTVAVNALNAFAQVAYKATVDHAGGDSASIKWIELPIPEMQTSVARGTVDAAITTEPFVTRAKASDSGVRPVDGGAFAAAAGGLPQLVYIASTEYVEKNPETVKAFVSSINAAAGKLQADPRLVRTVAKTSTSVKPSEIEQMLVPGFGPLTMDQVDELETMMVRYAVIKKPVDDLSDHVYLPN